MANTYGPKIGRALVKKPRNCKKRISQHHGHLKRIEPDTAGDSPSTFSTTVNPLSDIIQIRDVNIR